MNDAPSSPIAKGSLETNDGVHPSPGHLQSQERGEGTAPHIGLASRTTPSTARRSAFAKSFRRWVENQDEAAVHGAANVGVWFGVALFIVPALSAAAFVPAFARFFELNYVAALLAFTLPFTNGLVFSVLHRNRLRLEWWGWAQIIAGSGFLKFFCASLISFSAPRASVVFSALLLLACTFHGHLHRGTMREPFTVIASVVAIASAALLAPTTEHLAIFLIIGPGAIVAELIAGNAAARQVESTRHHEQMKAAINAQMLAQQNSEVRRLSGTIVDLLGHSHDINNALTSAILSAESLHAMAEMRQASGDEAELFQELEETLTHIRATVDNVRSLGREAAENSLELVEPEPVVNSVLAAARQRFPATRVELANQMANGTALFVRGGGVHLRRIVENLVLNACEGDGAAGAGHVVVRLRHDTTGANAELLVEDDGPGFVQAFLDRPIDVFNSSKEKGTGLGLYTTEKLVQASGGILERRNRAEGGAAVRIVLPLAPATAA